MPRDSLTLATADFQPVWGDKSANLARIAEWTAQAAEQGAELVLFPETALTGYDTPGDDASMHRDAAESLSGPAVAELVALARRHSLWLIVGLVERDAADGRIYNSALVAGPDGLVGCYRKLHPAARESLWAAKGDEPLLFESPWGPIGIGICYDTYHFPELLRAYAAMGARLSLNPTAVPIFEGWRDYYLNQLKARVIENGLFVASANLVGIDRDLRFPGASLVIGPTEGSPTSPHCYMEPVEGSPGIRIVTIDLSISDRARDKLPIFTDNPLTGEPDWRPDVCERLLARVRSHRGPSA